MLMCDEMTPKERLNAFYEGRPYDRIPTNIFMSDNIAALVNAKSRELHLSARVNTAAQVAAYNAFHMDGAVVLLGVAGISEALGTILEFPDESTPFVKEYAIKKYDDIDKIEIPEFSKAARYPMFFENIEMLLESFGDEVPVDVCLSGPFTCAANLYGTQNFMRDLYISPEFIHRLIKISLDASMVFIRKAAVFDITFSVGEPTASLINKRMFQDFVFPYLKELIDGIRSLNKRLSSLHICGNTKKIWEDMVNTGADILSLDECIDLADAKNRVGLKAALMGNVPPTDVMLLGTPETVDLAVKTCIAKACDNPKGYILGLGCGLPKNTPPENIHAFFDAARKYGQYPLKNP
jgi:uroporphyrinogen decarboxylase